MRDRLEAIVRDGFRKTGTLYLVFKEHRKANRDYTAWLFPVKGSRPTGQKIPCPCEPPAILADFA